MYYFFVGSTEYVKGTSIDIDGELPLRCEYHPPLGQANLTGLKQVACASVIVLLKMGQLTFAEG